jgi:hypothetical protein
MQEIVFSTVVRSLAGKERARLLILSLRTFGGELKDAPFWLFEADSMAGCGSLDIEGVQVIPLRVPEPVKSYIFADKVYACACAEELAAGQVQSLVWMDSNCLVVNPPVLYALGSGFDAALRPVHIRNVGLRWDDPLDLYWQRIYEVVGVHDVHMKVDSFVDQQKLRAYFNSHAFSVNPSLGLFHQWFEKFQTLVLDLDFQQLACQDDPHQIFLFQALLSALLVNDLQPSRIRILPPVYNYPYNLHQSVPDSVRARSLNDVTSFTYEDRSLDPDEIQDIAINQPLRAWLSENLKPE